MKRKKRAPVPELIQRKITPAPPSDEIGLKPAEGSMVTTITVFYDREVNRVVRTEPAGFEKEIKLIGMAMMLPSPVFSLHPANFGQMIEWRFEVADGQFKEFKKMERREARKAIPQGRSVKI